MSHISTTSTASAFATTYRALCSEVEKVIIGQKDVVDEVLICLFAGGHALLEGAPGLGKTLLVRTLAEATDLSFSRIQFTPDLMPSDIIGTRIVTEDDQGRRLFHLSKGPIFGQLVLADEINRATPKTQSALLEAMAEQSVTIFGEQHTLEAPFCVLATENPIEMEGTYTLPEAQLDRFLLKVLVPAPDAQTLTQIIERTTSTATPQVDPVVTASDILSMRDAVRAVHIAKPLVEYVSRLIHATDVHETSAAPTAKKWLRYGAGVRGAQAIVLGAKVHALIKGREHVSREDIKRIALPALRHRILLSFEAEAEHIAPDTIVSDILNEVDEVDPAVKAIAG